MKTKVLFFVSLFLVVSFCEREEHPGKEIIFENTTFIYKYFKTEKECNDAQTSDFFINCHSQLNFMEDGVAEIIITDIIWRGEYRVIKKSIILTFLNNPEIPEETLVFKILNENKLKRIDDKTIWERLEGDSIWDKDF